MRFFGFILLWLVMSCAAHAAEWQSYGNDRFGYSVDIPPGFTLEQEADNSDGGTFTTKNGDRLLIFGITLIDAFEGEASNRIGYAMDNGWKITYSRVEPDWAVYSGTKGNRILYVHAAQLCDGIAALAMFEYRKQDIKAYDPIIKRVAKTLKSTDCPL